MAYTITAQRVPKEYRNKRIYAGGIIIGSTSGIGGSGTGGSAYIAGNGVTINVNEISLDTNFIEVTPAQGMKLKYNNITELEIISGGVEVKNILKVGTIQERVADAGVNVNDSTFTVKQTVPGTNATLNITHTDNTNVGSNCTFSISVTGGATTNIYSYNTEITGNIGGVAKAGASVLYAGSDSTSLLLMAAADIPIYLSRNGAVRFEVTATGVAITNDLAVNSDLYSKDTTFDSGFTGKGWKLSKAGSGEEATYGLEVDSLRVRGEMNVYELILNQIRATNGSLWVSDAAKIDSAGVGETYDYDILFDIDNNNLPVPFVLNDLLRCQQFDGRSVKYYVVQVKEVIANDELAVDIVDGVGVPAANDALVRMGNTTDEDRQGAIYMTASDSNNPYIDVLSGVNSGTAALGSFRKARLGHLTGITDSEFGALNGYGLWSENAYLTGSIKATAGKIANWTLSGNRIQAIPATNPDGRGLYIDCVGDGGVTGLGVYMYGSPPVGKIRSVGLGQLHNMDSRDTLSSDWGFEVIKRTGTDTHKHIIRIGSADNLIAGWHIDHEAFFTGTKDTDGGFNEAGGITLAADGGIHSPNFYVDPDGDVGFRGKEIIYAYKGTSTTDLQHSHDAPVSGITTSYVLKKTITIGSGLQGSVSIVFDWRQKITDGGYYAYAELRKNGVAITGSERIENSTDYVTQTHVTVDSIVKDDTIELWVKKSGGTGAVIAYCDQFRMYGEVAEVVYELTGANS